MGKMLSALLHLQSIERQLTHVKRQLKSRQNAVNAQTGRIEQFQAAWQALHDRMMNRRKDADRLDLDLKEREQQVEKFRTVLNGAKTNKEYAAILTQINTLKADNAKFEEEGLKLMQEADALREQVQQAQQEIQAQEQRLQEIKASSGEEIVKLTKMMEELSAQRAVAAAAVPADALRVFERVASKNEGDAMAAIEIRGRKPPHEYICGGCYMSLNAEHANALRTRDEVRTCDNCGRILYLEPQAQQANAD